MVNAHLVSQGWRGVVLDATYVGKLERGEHRWPQSRYRNAFRAVLRAAKDCDLGFFIVRRQST
ncbi:hypothetical protein AB0B31_10625 [Catellatospora citrea]|uniref:hypothetical protein n=1 Tax=Catellatospora citrea TaxID=53366 RepID=UPI0033C31685